MTQLKDYTKRYSVDPLTLNIDIHNIKEGLYHINGEANAEKWLKVCKTADIKPLGDVNIDIDMQRFSFKIHLTGTITAQVERTCIRTLKPFKTNININIDEEIFTTKPREDEDPDEILQGSIFDVGDFIEQMVNLNIDPYPIHESTLNVPVGEFGLSDGIEEEVKEQQNPFAVLKDLKKS